MDITAIIGNLLALLGEMLLVVSASSTGKARTMGFHAAALSSVALANLVLGGYGGALVNAVGIARNLLIIRGHDSLSMRISVSAMLVAMSVTMGVATGFQDRLFWLPLAANLLYTMCGHLRDWRFKAMCSANLMMWLPYDLLLGNYVSAVSDAANIALSIRAALKLRHGKQSEAKALGASPPVDRRGEAENAELPYNLSESSSSRASDPSSSPSSSESSESSR